MLVIILPRRGLGGGRELGLVVDQVQGVAGDGPARLLGDVLLLVVENVSVVVPVSEAELLADQRHVGHRDLTGQVGQV